MCAPVSEEVTDSGDPTDPACSGGAEGRGHRGGVRGPQPAAVRTALSARRAGERLLAVLPPGASAGSVRLELVGARTQHVRVRAAALRPAPQQGHLPGERGLDLPVLVARSRQPARGRAAARRGSARDRGLPHAPRLPGLQRLHTGPPGTAGDAPRRRADGRERVDLRAGCLGPGGAAARHRGAGRVRGLLRAGGAPSRGRVALGRRPQPAAGGRGMGGRQRLLRPVPRVVRRAAGRPDHPAPGQAPLLQLAALAGRPGHRGGDGRVRRGGGGPPGGDGAGAPSRRLSLHGGILRRGALGRRGLPGGAAGVDAPRGERAGRVCSFPC